ncbi:TadE/TadG family type IV pilus assembly protein [Pseudonocardia alni]|uniref:TadE/TadG family type IV pilus assembly protein n=1 Tax=Pseudonocardia alni TaxID=33907 RepID=UPI0033235FBE
MSPIAALPDTGDRGGSTSVEMALLWGVLLLLILAVVQVALLSYAGQLALTAAQDGLSSGRAYGTETVTDTAQRDAAGFLDRAAGTVLSDVTVTATVDDGQGLLTVRVTGTALSLVPGLPLAVTREAVGGLERPAP